MRRIKKWATNICLLILTCIVSFLISEFILRLKEYKKPPNFSLAYRYYFKPDSELGYDIQENFPKTKAHIEGNYFYEFWSNELGCFDTPYKEQVDYILLLGDSFTHLFAPFKDKWGTIAQNILDFRVLQCGVVGYGTKQEFLKAKKIISKIKRPPKLIIIGYHINDFTEDYLFPSTTVVKGFTVATFKISDIKSGVVTRKDILTLEKEVGEYEKSQNNNDSFLTVVKSWFLKNSILCNKVKEIIRNIFHILLYRPKQEATRPVLPPPIPPGYWFFGFLSLPENEYPWLKKGWGIHFANFRAFKRLADNLGTNLLVVIIPAKHQIYFPQQLKDNGIDLDTPIRKLCKFFEREKIAYIDLQPLFKRYAKHDSHNSLDPEKDLYWRIDGHWNKKGSHLAGLLVSDYIVENNLIPVQNKDKKLREIKEQLKEFE
jgi:hypothetical protein